MHNSPQMDYFWLYIIFALIFMGAIILASPRLMSYLDNRQTKKQERGAKPLDNEIRSAD